MPYDPNNQTATTTTVDYNNTRRRAGGVPGVTGRPARPGGQRPATGGQPGGASMSGTSVFRRNMPRGPGVGGVAGPSTVSGPSVKGPGVGGSGVLSTTPTTPTPSVTPKGGGVANVPGGEAARPKPNPAAGGVIRPTVPNLAGSPLYGGFNPAQLVQQNGQWGGVGQTGNFQALGGPALASWLRAQAQVPGAAGPTPPGPPPSGPIMAPGYLTAEQFMSPAYDWFRNSQPQGANDWNAFNQWFQQYGQQYDPTGWNQLYGSNANQANGGLIYGSTG